MAVPDVRHIFCVFALQPSHAAGGRRLNWWCSSASGYLLWGRQMTSKPTCCYHDGPRLQFCFIHLFDCFLLTQHQQIIRICQEENASVHAGRRCGLMPELHFLCCVRTALSTDTQHYSSCKCLRRAFLFLTAQAFKMTSLDHSQSEKHKGLFLEEIIFNILFRLF